MYPLLAALEFEHPLRLIWLAIAPVIVYFAIRSRTSAPAWRRAASLVCRLLVLTLAILAFAGLAWRGPSEQRFVVFATDISRSVAGGGRQAAEQFIAAARQQQGGHEAAFLPFADKPGAVTAEPQFTDETLDINSSDPAAALQLAAATIPVDFVPQVVLLTDGNETGGDLARAALGVGVPVAVVPLPGFADPEVCVTDLLAPTEVAPGADVPWEVVIHANLETTGTLELLRDGELAARSDVTLRPGENRIRLQTPLDAGVAASVTPAATFTARLAAKQDTIAENNQRRARVVASRPVRVLLADAEPTTTGSFRDVLAWQGFEVTAQPPAELAASAAALDAFDVLVLSDVPSKDLNADQLQAIDDYVGVQGGGLIVLGGERTFGETAFRDTPLERLLPVTAAAATEEAEKAVLAMVLVIDRSQSMEEDRRLDLAKEAAKQSVRVLEPHDKAGVIAFSDDAEWIANLAPVADKAELLQRIDTLTPYGQTHMYRGVVRAVLALEQTAADRRHMILLTDGVPAPGDYREIARRMAASGITLSTVSISKGAEQDLLKEMAAIAGGRHNHCDDPSAVPRILVQETKVAAADEGYREFRPFALRTLPGLDVASAPPLLGYARTNPKPDAEPLLFAVAGHPLLCWGRYGKGLTLAFTSDVKGPWIARWKSWPGYGAFWKRLVRHVARQPQPSPLTVSARRSRGTITVTADLTAADGRYATDVPLTATVAETRAEPQTLTLEPVAPGRYAATFTAPAPIPAEYEIRVTGPGSNDLPLAATQTVFIDYPDELRLQATNEDLLGRVAETTGGVFRPEPASVFAPDGRTVHRVAPLWTGLLLAALLLFVGDVALRRLRF
jgi:Ca-activated chloride channel homolog